MALSSRSSTPSRRHRRRLTRRATVVGIAAAAVVIGQASAALATPATPPTASVAVNETLMPVLHGVSTDAGTGSHSMHFYARTVGSSTWNLLNDDAVTGGNEFAQLPSGQLSIGQAFEYQISDCDSTGCTPSAIQTGYVSPDLAAGQRQGATRLPFNVGDKIKAQVDVGTGNLFVSTTQLSLPRIEGSLGLGVAYNSLTLAPGSRFTSIVSPGWRVSTGDDIRLITNADNSVTFYGPDGVTGTFFPSGSAYSSANTNIKGSVTSGPIFTDHSTGDAYHFTSSGRLDHIVSKNGTWTSFSHDYSKNWTGISTDKAGTAGAAAVNLDGSGRLAGFTQSPSSGTSRSVNYTYDSNGRLSEITDTLGRHTDFGYSSAGDLASITAPGGAETDFAYDGNHRVTSVTQPSAGTTNAVTRLVYNSGQTLMATPNTDQSQAVSAVPHTTYDLTTTGPAAGQLLVNDALDPNNKKRSATYSPFDDVASTTDNAGNQTMFGYPTSTNNGESFTGTTLPTGATTQYSYGNAAGQTSQFYPSNGTDAQSNSGTYSYDGPGNLIKSSSDSTGATAKIDYNTSDGTIKDTVDPAGNQTNYSYVLDSTGKSTRLISTITPPAGSGLGVKTYTYDAYGRIATYQSGRLDSSSQPITQTFSYDDGDRVTQVDYSDGTPSVHYTYNNAGQVATRTDASGTTTYTYDPLGRLASKVNTAGGGLLSYAYDLDGNLVNEADGNGTTTDAYDSRDLLTSTTTPDGKVTAFKYDDNARRTDTWFATNSGNSIWAAHTTTAYDKSGRVTRVTTSRASSDSTLVSDLSYSYAAPASSSCSTVVAAQGADTGLRWSQTDNLTGLTTSYCYDQANRLTDATTPGGDTWHYTYDTNGNRTQATKNGTTVQSFQPFDSGNQQTSADGYSYDKAGNLTTAPGNLHLSYNGSDQQTGRTGSGTSSWTYAGTDQTELTNQTIPGGSTYTYAYGRTDQNGLPILDTFTNPNGTSYLIHDDRGTPLAIKTWQGSYSYYVLDGLGSPVAMINPAGTVQATYTYDPWGNVTVNNPTNSTVANLQPYRFAGGMLDRSTGYLKFGMRYYDPGTGRFTQQDSVEVMGDPSRGNRYEYAGDDPINSIDPAGLIALNIGGSICFIVCVSGSFSFGTSGISATAGLGAGISAGAELAGTLTSGDGLSSGFGSEFDCSGPGVTGGVSGSGESDVGLSTATEYGCADYATDSATLVTY